MIPSAETVHPAMSQLIGPKILVERRSEHKFAEVKFRTELPSHKLCNDRSNTYLKGIRKVIDIVWVLKWVKEPKLLHSPMPLLRIN
jgi:hypothetical protein